MDQLGLLARLKFNSEGAVSGMGRATTGVTKFAAGAKQAKEGVRQLKTGMAGLNLAMTAVAGASGFAVKKFSDFSAKFGAVKAVLGKEAQDSFAGLEESAQTLGATTSFTAAQAAEAMENLARSGMDANEILSSITPTLDAAAAEGMDLATAADIVASNLRAFGLEAKDAATVADTLAFVSAKTNTNMVMLQEGLKYAGPVARSVGIDFQKTTAILGAFADVGLKGSLAGTGFKNAILRMAQAAKGSHRLMVGNYKATIVTKDGQLDFLGTLQNVGRALHKIQDPMRRASALIKVLGLRGMGAETAISALSDTKLDVVFGGLAKGVQVGKAAEMAAVRLDNLHGSFVRLTSAADGFQNAVGKALAPTVERVIGGPQGLTVMIGDAAKAFQALLTANGPGELERRLGGLNTTAVDFVRGLNAGLAGAKEIFSGLASVARVTYRALSGIVSPFGFLGEKGSGVKGMTELAVKGIALAAALKISTSAFTRMGRLIYGSVQLIRGGIGMAQGAAKGMVGFISRTMPTFAKVLPKSLGKLTGATKALDTAMAQPVRVVNWAEARLAGLGAAGPMAPTGGAGPVTAGGGKQARGLITATTKLGKVAQVASGGVALLGAAIAGWEIGRAIDEATGFSDWLSSKGVKSTASEEAAKLHEDRIATVNAMREAVQMLKFSREGRQVQFEKGGPKQAVTREAVRSVIAGRVMKSDASLGQQMAIMKTIDSIIARIPTREEAEKSRTARQPIEMTTHVVLDGRKVGQGTARAEIEAVSRSQGGSAVAPGARRRAAAR